jgi:hypothetical protein
MLPEMPVDTAPPAMNRPPKIVDAIPAEYQNADRAWATTLTSFPFGRRNSRDDAMPRPLTRNAPCGDMCNLHGTVLVLLGLVGPRSSRKKAETAIRATRRARLVTTRDYPDRVTIGA